VSQAIHSSAVIDRSAHLGANVRIGPFAVVEADTVVGEESELQAHTVVCRGTILGARNMIGYGAVLGADPQDFSYKGQPSHVEIGSGNRIREYVTIHRATVENGATRVGDDNFIMGGVHLGHDTRVGNGAILANNTLLAGHVQVGDRAFLGGATIVHQHVRIGALAITRGGTRLGKDVPPYLMAVATNQVSGINRLGLRRAGFSQETRRTIQAAYELIYRANLNITQALSELRAKFHQPEILAFIEFIASSQRGICKERRRGEEDEE
jgi:UDP-N-acetylglucosamine acyltransferase